MANGSTAGMIRGIENTLMQLKRKIEEESENAKKKGFAEGESNGYKAGYDDGYNDWKAQHTVIDEVKDAEYNKGLEEAWKLAKQVAISSKLKKDVFGNKCMTDIFKEHTPQEAIEKMRRYNETNYPFSVGDEVSIKSSCDDCSSGLIINFNAVSVSVLKTNGEVGEYLNEDVEKTGIHYNMDYIIKESPNA